MKKARRDFLISAPDDGLPADAVGAWSETKYRILGIYAEMFSTGMKNQWPTRVYIDLFAGSGHALLGDSRRRVLGSPLIALSIRDPFTKYVFCEQEIAKRKALETRAQAMAPLASIACIEGDANEHAAEIAAHIPPHSRANRVLSFCFIDPYNLRIDFDTVTALGAGRAMDFVILLALPMDAVRNWAAYVKEGNDRVDRFLGSADWRARWKDAEKQRISETRFLAGEYAAAMAKLQYLPTTIDQMIPIRSTEKNLPLYYLAFFSKNEKGYTFWEQARKYAKDQLELGLS